MSNNLLESLGFSKKTHVGISVSPNNFIELVSVDKSQKRVVRYASETVKYNGAIREIMDYDEFAEVVERLFEEAGLIPSECSVTLSIPNVHYGVSDCDSESSVGYVLEEVQDEVESMYIFKRSGNEPVISHSVMLDRAGKMFGKVIYSAIQGKAVFKLVEVFEGLGCEIKRIDTAYNSLLKSIQFCDRFNKYVEPEEQTLVLLITSNSCSSFYLESGCLMDYFEEPLAVKSFSQEEVYATISKITENAVTKCKPQNLLIISETDEVDPSVLTNSMDLTCEVDCINKGINSNETFIELPEDDDDGDSNMFSFLTIEAVGAAVSDFDNYPMNLNFVPANKQKKDVVNIGPYEVPFNSLVATFLGGAVLSAFAILAIAFMLLNAQNQNLDAQTQKANDDIQVFRGKMSNQAEGQVALFPTLKQIVDNNAIATNSYIALSTDIPEHIYIKQFITNADGAILIVGKATSSEAVNEFIKALRAKNPDLMLSKMSVDDGMFGVGGSNDFTFEIKTASHDVNAGTATTDGQQAADPNAVNNSGTLTPPPSATVI